MRTANIIWVTLAPTALAIATAFSGMGIAQSVEGPTEFEGVREGGGALSDSALATIPSWTPVNAATTGRIVNALNAAAEFCRAKADRAFALDCMNYEYWKIVETLPETGEYAEVRVALEGVATRMSGLVTRHRDSSPAQTLSRTGIQPKVTTRKINPIVAPAISSSAREAADAIAEAQTLLLRSTGNSDLRRAQFQRIAQAMESGAILLRSL
ncbi:hypothetical protein [Ruegeria marina]|uniref:Uncharacterized protein n=1 Tax=Ruegeria marina TaxID=639004 RepID=A0A1G7D027_9RHOB|nr:hypothetical protein [Ruegeria marina]SDE44286.1 hypothetical protein SAMN04488239_11963 [Ruegeria marina]